MLNETVIVTIQSDTYCADFELPSGEPLESLYPRLCSAIKKDAPSKFGFYDGIVLEFDGKGLLNGRLCLRDYGIVNGNKLTIVSAEKYHELGGKG